MERSCYKFDADKSEWIKTKAELKASLLYVKPIEIGGRVLWMYINPEDESLYAFVVPPENR